MFYAVKVGRIPGIYEDYKEALKQVSGFPLNEMKKFKKKKEAEIYLNEVSIDNCFYVVKRGRVPGIYSNKKDVSLQVKNFKNPFVKTFKDKTEAEKFLEEDIPDFQLKSRKQLKEEKEKKEKKFVKKAEKCLNNGIFLKGRFISFIDVEANNGIGVSLGAVIYDSVQKEIVDEFYSLMKYSEFVEMDSYCKRINHLETEDILNAPKSDDVFNSFVSFLENYDVKDIFSWGNNDYHYLKKTLENKELLKKVKGLKNIQSIISYSTKDYVLNKTWSLKSMKEFYGLDGIVSHNSLDDAKDLCKVFKCFQEKKEFSKEGLKNLNNKQEE